MYTTYLHYMLYRYRYYIIFTYSYKNSAVFFIDLGSLKDNVLIKLLFKYYNKCSTCIHFLHLKYMFLLNYFYYYYTMNYFFLLGSYSCFKFLQIYFQYMS